jgi:hypothetical protein
MICKNLSAQRGKKLNPAPKSSDSSLNLKSKIQNSKLAASASASVLSVVNPFSSSSTPPLAIAVRTSSLAPSSSPFRFAIGNQQSYSRPRFAEAKVSGRATNSRRGWEPKWSRSCPVQPVHERSTYFYRGEGGVPLPLPLNSQFSNAQPVCSAKQNTRPTHGKHTPHTPQNHTKHTANTRKHSKTHAIFFIPRHSQRSGAFPHLLIRRKRPSSQRTLKTNRTRPGWNRPNSDHSSFAQ